MSLSKNDVVSVVTLAGEIIGKYKSETTNDVTIADPRLLSQNEQGLILVPSLCMTGKPELDEVTLSKTSVVLMVPTVEEVEKEYRANTSGIVI